MKRIRVLFIVFFLLSVVGGSMYELDRRGFFLLGEIEVDVRRGEGSAAYLEPWLAELKSELGSFEGRSLWTLPLDEISTVLTSRIWISDHHLVRQWPSSLKVVVEIHPVQAVVMGRRGQLMPVLGDGRLLEAVAPSHAPDVVVLDGREFVENTELRKKAVDLIEELPDKGRFSKETVASVRWEAKRGFEARMTDRGVRVRLGEELIAEKSARLSQVIDYLESRGLRAEVLDANLSKKVLVRLKEDSSKSKPAAVDVPYDGLRPSDYEEWSKISL